MLSLPSSIRIMLCLEPTDMRRSFDGLSAMVQGIMKEDPFSGHLFVFRNRRGDRLKILYWDHDGYALWYKRLEEGTFRFPSREGHGTRLEIRAADLAAILEGIDLSRAKRRKRYRRKCA